MKLKQIPEDFIVEEVISDDFIIKKEKSSYKIYILEKRGLEIFEVISYLSRENNIPKQKIGYAGLKDKHALTRQYISIPLEFKIKNEPKGSKISFIGYCDNCIKYGDLKENKFIITVRDVRKGELDGVYQKSENISDYLFPNYFDSQRFGSLIDGQFIAKELIKKNYESALKIYLTKFIKSESSKIKNDKEEIKKAWPNFESIKIFDKKIKEIIYEYKKTKDFLSAYLKIPKEIRLIHLYAYQSYIWNECLKIIIRNQIDNKHVYSIQYAAGTLLFYRKISKDTHLKLNELTLHTISDNLTEEEHEKKAVAYVLKKEGLLKSDFKINTGNYFESVKRSTFFKIHNFEISKPINDELNIKSYKIRLSFTLPKGSYATIVTKRLFNH
jgi:tRNA pseudouridine13 synthase